MKGSIKIPSPDGYHYGDDHEWGPAEAASMLAFIRRIIAARKQAKTSPAKEEEC